MIWTYLIAFFGITATLFRALTAFLADKFITWLLQCNRAYHAKTLTIPTNTTVICEKY